jgi:predicted DCC family thiol-disulfide oxidoreductase YuxK
MENQPVVLFDGVCNLCNGSVQWLILRDPNSKLRFAALQSDFGQNILKKNNLNTLDFNSFILVEGEKIWLKSDAALRVVSYLGGGWSWLRLLQIVPTFIRNFFYDIMAKNRYRWFGKKESCWLPTPELRARFLK